MKKRNVNFSQENKVSSTTSNSDKEQKEKSSEYHTLTKIVNIFNTLIWFMTGGTMIYTLYSEKIRNLVTRFEFFTHSSFIVIVVIVFIHITVGHYLKRVKLTVFMLLVYSAAHVMIMIKIFYSLPISGSAVAFLYLICQLFTISSFLTFYTTYSSAKELSVSTGIIIVVVGIGFFHFTTSHDESFQVDSTKIAASSILSFLYGLYMIYQTKKIYNGYTLISNIVHSHRLLPNDYSFAILSVFVDFIFGYAAPFFCVYTLIRRNTTWDPLDFLTKI